MQNIYFTRNIYENLDLRLFAAIKELLKIKILKTKKEDLDKFQIFEVQDNQLIHRQEQPEYSEKYDLIGSFKNAKVWAVQGIDEKIGKYWTLMFPEDY